MDQLWGPMCECHSPQCLAQGEQDNEVCEPGLSQPGSEEGNGGDFTGLKVHSGNTEPDFHMVWSTLHASTEGQDTADLALFLSHLQGILLPRQSLTESAPQ